MRQVLCLAALIFVAVQGSALGQDASAYEPYRAFGENALRDRIYPAFKRALNKDEWARVRRIEIVFPARLRIDWVFAATVHGSPRIDVSTGTLVEMHRLVEASLYVFDHGGNETRIRYLQKVLATVLAGSKPGAIPKMAISYPEFAKANPVEVQRWREEQHGLINQIMVESLAFFVAHEIGHHLLGHLQIDVHTAADAKRVRDQEYAADSFALDLIHRAGFNPVTVLPFFEFLSLFEGFATHPSGSASHDPAMCRFVRFMNEGTGTMLSDPAFQDALKAQPKLRSQYEEMNGLWAKLKNENDCAR